MARARPRALDGDGPGFGGRGVHSPAAASATKAGHARRHERGAERNLPHPLPRQQSLRITPVQGDQERQQQPEPRPSLRPARVQSASFLPRGESRCRGGGRNGYSGRVVAVERSD